MEIQVQTREKDDKIPLQTIFDKKYPCLKCAKLQVDRKSTNLDCNCLAFTEMCFLWSKNANVPPWEMKCWGLCTDENAMLDIGDEIYQYNLNKVMEKGHSACYAKNYVDTQRRNQKLSTEQMVGLKEFYYSETHPPIIGGSKNESVGKACTIIKKNPLLDGEMSGKSWKGVGSIDMSTYDAIEENKRRKRESNKMEIKSQSKKDIKGVDEVIKKKRLGLKKK